MYILLVFVLLDYNFVFFCIQRPTPHYITIILLFNYCSFLILLVRYSSDHTVFILCDPLT